jgi:single-strand DNA-binding protein
MRGINSLFLLGTLRVEPDQLTSKSGKNYVRFELHVLTIRRVNGVDEEQHEIVPVTAFGKLAEIIMKYVKRGDPIHIVAHISSSEFRAAAGTARRSISVVADSVQLLPNGRNQYAGGQSPGPGEPSEQPLPKLQKEPFDENGDLVTLPF